MSDESDEEDESVIEVPHRRGKATDSSSDNKKLPLDLTPAIHYPLILTS